MQEMRNKRTNDEWQRQTNMTKRQKMDEKTEEIEAKQSDAAAIQLCHVIPIQGNGQVLSELGFKILDEAKQKTQMPDKWTSWLDNDCTYFFDADRKVRALMSHGPNKLLLMDGRVECRTLRCTLSTGAMATMAMGNESNESVLAKLGIEVLGHNHTLLPRGWHCSKHLKKRSDGIEVGYIKILNTFGKEVARQENDQVTVTKEETTETKAITDDGKVQSKKRKKSSEAKTKTNSKAVSKKKRQNVALSLTEANDAAGFVPNEITALMQRGYTHPEAYVRLLTHWPNPTGRDSMNGSGSANMCRRLEKRLSKEVLNDKQRTELKTKLDADHVCGYERFYQVSISTPQHQCGNFYFSSVQKACQALIDVLKSFPEQNVTVFSDDLAKGKTKWRLPLSTFIRRLEITIEKKRTKMIKFEDMAVDMTPGDRFGNLFRIWVREHQFCSNIELTEIGSVLD